MPGRGRGRFLVIRRLAAVRRWARLATAAHCPSRRARNEAQLTGPVAGFWLLDHDYERFNRNNFKVRY